MLDDVHAPPKRMTVSSVDWKTMFAWATQSGSVGGTICFHVAEVGSYEYISVFSLVSMPSISISPRAGS